MNRMAAELHNIGIRKNIGAAKGLLQSLVPRAQCFCFYDLARSCVWSSDGVDDYEIDALISELPLEVIAGADPESGKLRRTLTSGRTLLILPVGSENGQSLGMLVAVFSKNAGKSSWFNPSLLQGILQPAVSLIGENLRISQELANADTRAQQADEELQLVYKIDEKTHGTSRSHAGLAQLIGQSGRFLGIAYSVLLLPAKRIRISATHSSWKTVNRKAMDRYIIDTLFPQLEDQRGPVIFDVPAVAGSESVNDQGFQAMVCPLTDRAGNLEGVVAQLGRINKAAFEPPHMRFMSHIVRKIEYVIEQSFDAMTGLMNRAGFEARLKQTEAIVQNQDNR
ncbi:MAG: hypothetical protein RLN69_08935, partial [Woeseiaceae bacterium]